VGGLSAGVTVAARAARVCTVCMMAAYILAFIVETREYSYRTTPGRDRYTPFPGFAWITGTIAGALWVIAGSAGCCAPPQDVLLCTALKAWRVGRAVGRNEWRARAWSHRPCDAVLHDYNMFTGPCDWQGSAQRWTLDKAYRFTK